jgi:hypothetical protein
LEGVLDPLAHQLLNKIKFPGLRCNNDTAEPVKGILSNSLGSKKLVCEIVAFNPATAIGDPCACKVSFLGCRKVASTGTSAE